MVNALPPDAPKSKSRRRKRRKEPGEELTRPRAVINAGKLIPRLPEYGPIGTLRIWENAVRIHAESPHEEDRREAKILIRAIEDTWRMRAQGEAPSDWPEWTLLDSAVAGGQADEVNWPKLGVLGMLGYQVGEKGKSRAVRRGILARAYEGDLPPLLPASQLWEWGDPSTAKRLRKLAESIASFARNAKANDAKKFARAIRDWDEDLGYLRQTYHRGEFRFMWPHV
jgi:hypothetical protein